MTEPIPFRVTRYRCPHCPRTGASKARVGEHIGRCWSNPEARGCKTCKHFEAAADQCCGLPDVNQCYTPWCSDVADRCAVGISLAGRQACEKCGGANWLPTGEIFRPRFATGGPVYAQCEACGGNGAEVKPGPLVGCARWELAEPDGDAS